MKSFLNQLAWLYFTLTLYFYHLNAFLPVSQTEWIEKIPNLNVCSRISVRRILVIFHLIPGKLFQTSFNMSSKLSMEYEKFKKKSFHQKKNIRRVFSISHIIAIDIKTLTHYKQHTSFWLATFIHDFRAKLFSDCLKMISWKKNHFSKIFPKIDSLMEKKNLGKHPRF